MNKSQLKQACKLSGSNWAVWLHHGRDGWQVGEHYSLNKSRLHALLSLMEKSKFKALISGSLSGGRMRYRTFAEEASDIDCRSIYVFPNTTIQAVLVVGTEKLDAQSSGFFQILAQNSIPKNNYPELTVDSRVLFKPFEIEPSYDLEGVLDQVLRYLINMTPCDGAFIALRYGDIFRVKCTWNLASEYLNLEMHVQKVSTLSKMTLTRQGFIVPLTDHKEERQNFQASNSHIYQFWMGIPIILGKRVIGVVGYLTDDKAVFSKKTIQEAAISVNQVAYLVENAIVFSEAARYLQQLALVTELAAAASSAVDVRQVATRVLQRLRRVFGKADISLSLLSLDREMLQEYFDTTRDGPVALTPVAGSLPGSVIDSGRPIRLGDISQSTSFTFIDPSVRSELAVPLKYRGNVIGALSLTSKEYDAFSLQDEQLMVMIASHLAGLIENVRLYEETRHRARNLNLIHQVVQHVIGLTDVQQIAMRVAELIVEQFDFDFSVVYLRDEKREKLILRGFAGDNNLSPPEELNQNDVDGIISLVLSERKGRIDNQRKSMNVNASNIGLSSGSEMCIPLFQADRIIGVLDVQRAQENAFLESDLMTIEALAAVFSSIILNAQNYQQLQTSLRQMNAVRETALDIAGDLDLDVLLRRVVNRVKELIDARGAELCLVEEDGGSVKIVVSENPWQDFAGITIPYMAGVEGQVAALGEPVVVNDYNTWSGRLYPERHMPYHAVAGFPLKLKGQVIGVLVVTDDRPERVFLEKDLQLLELLVPQVAVFIRHARLYQELSDRMESQKRAESQLIRSARLAAVGEMAAGVAHELNNPLTTVSGFIELVMNDMDKNSSQYNDLVLALQEAQRARGVVRRLLDFSRPVEDVRILSDINELISDVLTLVQHLVRTNNVELRIQLWEDLPWINIDPNQIKQVFLNLIHNGLQAMPKGGILTVQTLLQERMDDDWVTVAITDTGFGIAPEHIDRIFEPFFTTHPMGAGTGLGLSVSFGIVNEHGGFIEVQSELDNGSSFIVWLPVST